MIEVYKDFNLKNFELKANVLLDFEREKRLNSEKKFSLGSLGSKNSRNTNLSIESTPQRPISLSSFLNESKHISKQVTKVEIESPKKQITTTSPSLVLGSLFTTFSSSEVHANTSNLKTSAKTTATSFFVNSNKNAYNNSL